VGRSQSAALRNAFDFGFGFGFGFRFGFGSSKKTRKNRPL
jgi:hypothetical protein